MIFGLYVWHLKIRNMVGRAVAYSGRYFGDHGHISRVLLTWLVCLIILIWRAYSRLLQPEIYAEGALFISDALADGWQSTFYLYSGYIHGIPRIAALMATSFVPTAHIPLFTNIVCFLIAAGVSASIARSCYRWIIPSDAARVLAALALCLTPGLDSVLGNLANLHYLLFLFLTLLILKDPSIEYTKWEMLLAVTIVFSSGMIAALLPVAVYRLLLISAGNKEQAMTQIVRINSREFLFALIIVLPTLLLGLFIVFGGESAPSQTRILPVFDDLGYLLRAAADVFLTSMFLHPFAGTIAAEEIYIYVHFPFLLSLAVICTLLFVLRLSALIDKGFQLILVWLTIPFFLLTIIFIIREPQLEMFQVNLHWILYKWTFRYFYYYCAAGIFFWLILIRPDSLLPVKHRNALASIMFVAYASQANWYFNIDSYGEESMWAQTSSALESSRLKGCPRAVLVRTYPHKWGFTYKSSLKNESCRD